MASWFTRAWAKVFGSGRRAAPTRPAPRVPNHGGARRAGYDSAETTTENTNLWANADARSANASNSYDARRTLRMRSRYEIANNGYAGGLLETRTNETLGTGPRLQLNLPETPAALGEAAPVSGANATESPDPARQVELLFCEWWESVGFADKLAVIDLTEQRDGEVFALFVSNPTLPPDGPQLDLLTLEADQVTDPFATTIDPRNQDGVFLDEHGNPSQYRILRRHPGDIIGFSGQMWAYDDYAPDRVIHLFHKRRPGQARGIPALASSLPLFGQMRRYTSAVLGAAELAAEIGGVLTSETMPPDSSGAEVEVEGQDVIPFRRRMLLTLAAGQDVKAFDPTQPAPSYKEFKGEILTEAGRPVGAPRNVSTGSSAEYNYSSGRLDHLPWQRGIRIRRDRLRRVVLDRVFRAWYAEARKIFGYLPAGLPDDTSGFRWCWRWDGFDSIDPVKDATAAQARLAAGLSTWERECGEMGEDWEEVFAQQAREQALREKLGLPKPGAPAPNANPPQPPADTAGDGEPNYDPNKPDGGGGNDA